MITALPVISMLAAAAGLAATVLGFINRKKIAEVHVLVNSQLTEVLKRVSQLSHTLTNAGVDIPPPPAPPP
jgi:hypothetical protein